MRMRALAAALAVIATTASPAGADGARAVPESPKLVTGGLTVPWGIGWLPSGKAALVTQRDDGRVALVDRAGRRTDLGTVSQSQNTNGEGGLMGVAIPRDWDAARHPDVYFMHSAANDIRIARMTFDGRSLAGYRAIVTGIRKSTYHTGGQLAFGPDGHLYATTGDAQRPALAQDPDSLNGKILRLRTDGRPAPGNPFGTLVHSLGHRNPQGLAWDDAGRLWSAELGQDAHDELNLVEPGRNYGWPECEGRCGRAGFTDPKHTWAPAEAAPSGLAIVGNTAYLAAMRGERLWRIELSGTSVAEVTPHFVGRYGRLRAVSAVPGANEIWIGTTNADGNGKRPAGTDRILGSRLG